MTFYSNFSLVLLRSQDRILSRSGDRFIINSVNGRKEKMKLKKKKNDRSGKCGRSKKLTIMVRVERRARRE